MEIAFIKNKIISELQKLDYIESIQLEEVDEFSVKGSAYITKNYILIIRFKDFHGKIPLSFSLLYKNERIWGLDKDNKIGWHIHPLNNTSIHQTIEPKTIEEILEIFHSTISELLY